MLEATLHIDGGKLRRVRTEQLLSHRELARKAGLSPTTVIKLENDRIDVPHPRTVRKLVETLEVDPSELLRAD